MLGFVVFAAFRVFRGFLEPRENIGFRYFLNVGVSSQWCFLKTFSIKLELSPKLRQPVKTHFSLNGELSYGNVSTEVHEGI